MATISERIKEALEIRQLKQADLVEKTKIGKSSISTYISGAYEPKQKNIYLIAKALDVNEAWLMGYDVPMERKPTHNSEQAFMAYLNSLGYRIFRDDPEHKPFMSTGELICSLNYDTLDSLKLRIESYTKAIVDSELLALKEEELRQERLDKERILRQLSGENIIKGTQFEKDWNSSHLDLVAAHERTDIKVTDEMRKHDDDLMDNDELWNK